MINFNLAVFIGHNVTILNSYPISKEKNFKV